MGTISFARTLRKNQTDAEAKLWHRLRNRKVKGKKFLRQHPIVYKIQDSKTYSYVADFYCADKKLIIELDGGIHETKEQADYDIGRDALLNELGYNVVRFKNEELEDMEKVLVSVRNKLG